MRRNLENMPRPVNEEDLVGRFCNFLQTLNIGNKEFGFYRTELKMIQKDLTKCPVFPIYRQYKEGKIPNMDMLQNVVDVSLSILDKYKKEDKNISSQDSESIENIKKLLQGRILTLNSFINSYVRSVYDFYVIKKRRQSSGESFAKEFAKADERRRKNHNALMDSLNTFNKLLGSVRRFGEGDDDLSKIIFFNDLTLKNRDLIRDWAVAAYLHKHLQKAEEKMTSD